MKICMVSPYDLSLHGGVNKHVRRLGEALRALGDEVEIIGPCSGRSAGEGVTGFGGVVSIQGNGSDNRIGMLTSPMAVRAFVRAHAFDVLHVHEPHVPLLSWYALWGSRAPARVATFHRYSDGEPWTTLAARRMVTPLLPVQRGIAVSEAAARYARAVWRGPLAVIPNGVDARFFKPPAAERAEGPLRLLFVGHYTDRRKGLATLLAAYDRLKVPATLDVVGQGDPRLPPPAAMPGVFFRGGVSEPTLREYLHRCDVLVVPSTGQESFGMVLVEGMAAGAAIVCSDIEGYRQVALRAGAVLVPPGDAGALAEVLAGLAREPGRRRAMGTRNRREALRYDWGRIARRVREEYCAALAAPELISRRFVSGR
jgi:phosphatidylinositol alpha-mannosyltransferase